jgi:dihydroorotate dehydrogenase (NAD+) catalytic subunit
MACGAGSCKGCAIKMADGTFKQLCVDGPIFKAEELDWESFLPKPIIALKSSGKPIKNPLETILERKGGRKTILEYPWSVAPGCIGLEEAKKYHGLKIGMYRLKGVMLKERAGNEMPRICEAGYKSMMNSIGLTGIGINRSIKEELPEWLELRKPISFQIAGETIEEFFQVAEAIKDLPLAVVSLNISCPNIKVRGKFSFGTDINATYKIVSGVRMILPFVYLTVKLTPNVTDIVSIGEAAVHGGADCLEAINTVRGMLIDIKTRRPKIARRIGGYSGAGILPIGIAAIDQLYRADLGVPLDGMGGITCGEDALMYFLAGASQVEVGTEWTSNKNIFDEIEAVVLGYMEENHVSRIQDIVGVLE